MVERNALFFQLDRFAEDLPALYMDELGHLSVEAAQRVLVYTQSILDRPTEVISTESEWEAVRDPWSPADVGTNDHSTPLPSPPGPGEGTGLPSHQSPSPQTTRTGSRARQMCSADASARAKGGMMRTTLALDDELLAEAQRLTGTAEKSALVK